MRDGEGLGLGRVQDEVLGIKLLSKDSTKTSTHRDNTTAGSCIKSQPEQYSVKAEISIVRSLLGEMGASGSNNKEGIFVKQCLAVLWTNTSSLCPEPSWSSTRKSKDLY